MIVRNIIHSSRWKPHALLTHQQGAGNELGEELPSLGHELCRIRAEDAGTSVLRVSWDCADADAALEDIDGGLVVGIDDSGGAHCS